MKCFFVLCSLILFAHCKVLNFHHTYSDQRCVNMWDEGCVNGQLPGSGNDDYYLNGGFNPGKRCVNMWDEGCINGQLNGAGNDDSYLNGGFNPGKRCVNMWDEGCINGQLNGAGVCNASGIANTLLSHNGAGTWVTNARTQPKVIMAAYLKPKVVAIQAGLRPYHVADPGRRGNDDSYLNGGFNPGKRSLQDFFHRLQKSQQRHI